jgi:Ca2+-transporting ATPase
MNSEMGKLAGLLAEAAESASPLQIQIVRLCKRLATIAGGVASLIFALGLLRGDANILAVLLCDRIPICSGHI